MNAGDLNLGLSGVRVNILTHRAVFPSPVSAHPVSPLVDTSRLILLSFIFAFEMRSCHIPWIGFHLLGPKRLESLRPQVCSSVYGWVPLHYTLARSTGGFSLTDGFSSGPRMT